MTSEVSLLNLPFELFPEIFSFLTFSLNGRQALLQCCRVSKRFYADAQPHLFTFVDLNAGRTEYYCEETFELLQKLLSFRPSLAEYVKYLSFPALAARLPQFTDVLVSLVNLQGLSIGGEQESWDDIPLATQTVLIQTFFPKLSTLRIATIDPFPLLDVFRALSNIRELFLYYTLTAYLDESMFRDEHIHLPRLRRLILEGYDDGDLDQYTSLRSMLTHPWCKLETLVLEAPSGNAGDILSFFHNLCLGGMVKHLRRLYLNEDFFRLSLRDGFGDEPGTSVNFFDPLAAPYLEYLLLEIPDHRSVFDDSKFWEHSSPFFFHLSEMLGYRREHRDHPISLRSIHFVHVKTSYKWECSRSLSGAWTAFDNALVDSTLVPMLEKATFEKDFGNLDVLRTFLPRAMDAGLLCFGAATQYLTIWL
ncbi:hypothetical protein DL96DRAFT_1580940 [Flagelloscypha sp. PMI_526]|nr:hypothetical protein DL96DRAFT_1580940 [Flagelloscypha sp. PMI_526]